MAPKARRSNMSGDQSPPPSPAPLTGAPYGTPQEPGIRSGGVMQIELTDELGLSGGEFNRSQRTNRSQRSDRSLPVPQAGSRAGAWFGGRSSPRSPAAGSAPDTPERETADTWAKLHKGHSSACGPEGTVTKTGHKARVHEDKQDESLRRIEGIHESRQRLKGEPHPVTGNPKPWMAALGKPQAMFSYPTWHPGSKPVSPRSPRAPREPPEPDTTAIQETVAAASSAAVLAMIVSGVHEAGFYLSYMQLICCTCKGHMYKDAYVGTSDAPAPVEEVKMSDEDKTTSLAIIAGAVGLLSASLKTTSEASDIIAVLARVAHVTAVEMGDVKEQLRRDIKNSVYCYGLSRADIDETALQGHAADELQREHSALTTLAAGLHGTFEEQATRTPSRSGGSVDGRVGRMDEDEGDLRRGSMLPVREDTVPFAPANLSCLTGLATEAHSRMSAQRDELSYEPYENRVRGALKHYPGRVPSGTPQIKVRRDGLEAGMSALFRRVAQADKEAILQAGYDKDWATLTELMPGHKRGLDSKRKELNAERALWFWEKLSPVTRKKALHGWFGRISSKGHPESAASFRAWPKRLVQESHRDLIACEVHTDVPLTKHEGQEPPAGKGCMRCKRHIEKDIWYSCRRCQAVMCSVCHKLAGRVTNFGEFEDLFPAIAVITFEDTDKLGERAAQLAGIRRLPLGAGSRTELRLTRASGGFTHWRGEERAFEPLDLCDSHMLPRALAFVYLHRNEILTEELEGFTFEEWQQAWQYVLAKYLCAEQERDWVKAFARVFPAPPHVDVHGGDNTWLMAEAPDEGDHRDLRWAGVRQSDVDLVGYNKSFHGVLARHAESVLLKVFHVLDVAGDAYVDRNEIEQFYKILDVKESSGEISIDPRVAEICVDDDEKEKRKGWAKSVQGELWQSMNFMRQSLVFQQQTACSLNMSEEQLQIFVKHLMRATRPQREGHGRCTPKITFSDDVGTLQWNEGENVKWDDPSDRKQAALTIASFIHRGELGRLEWGLHQDDLEKLQIPDVELMGSAGCIVRADEQDRLEARFDDSDFRSKWWERVRDRYLRDQLDEIEEKRREASGGWNMDAPSMQAEALEKAKKEWEETEVREAHKLIFGTMITEREFKEAYAEACGINLNSPQFAYVWEELDARFNGIIPKQRFFSQCSTEPMGRLIGGLGGSYYLEFATYMRYRISVEINLYLYLLFIISFVLVAMLDKGIGPGYQTIKSIEDFIGQELQPNATDLADRLWYPMHVYDVANPDEWYQNFMPNVLEFVYGEGEGDRGLAHSHETSNKIIGGLKLQQWRVKPTGAPELEDLFENHAPGTCRAHADISAHIHRRYNDGYLGPTLSVGALNERASRVPYPSVACVYKQSTYSSSQASCSSAAGPHSGTRLQDLSSLQVSGTYMPLVSCAGADSQLSGSGCVYKWIPRVYTDYLADSYGAGTSLEAQLNAEPPQCNPEESDDFQAPTEFKRSIRLAVMNWDSGKLEAEVFKWLVEEYLKVRVEVIVTNAGGALSAMQANDGSVDVALEIWADNQAERLAAAEAAGAVNAGELGAEAEMNLYINKAGVELCSMCTHWNVLNAPNISKLFSCASTPGVVRCDERCTLCGGQCDCSAPDTIATAASKQGGAGVYSTAFRQWDVSGNSCSHSGTCDPNMGQMWDQAPAQGITTYGPEIHRSAELGASETWNMQFAATEDELVDRVVANSGIDVAANNPERPMVFFFYTPHALTENVGAKKVIGLPEYSEEDCPKPRGIDNAVYGGWNTSFSCQPPKQALLKVVSGTLQERHPDVYQLVKRMRFSNEDLSSMLRRILPERPPLDEVACDWLKENREKWEPWVHWKVEDDLAARQDQFFQYNFPTWATARADKESFTENAHTLEPGSTEGRSRQKELTDLHGQSVTVPTRREWDVLAQRANEGSVDAAEQWHYFRPWMYQTCGELHAGFLWRQGRPVSDDTLFDLQYHCDGYGTVLPISWTLTRAEAAVKNLEDNSWIDVATRAVAVEFYLYNQMTRLIVRASWLVEFSASGGVEISSFYTAFSLWDWDVRSLPGWCVLAFVNIVLIVYFTVYAYQRIMHTWVLQVASRRKLDASVGHNSWTTGCVWWGKVVAMLLHVLAVPGEALDLLQCVLLYIAWIMRAATMAMGLSSSNILCTQQYPDDYGVIADMNIMIDLLTGVNAIFLFLRVLFFMEIFPAMNRLLITLQRAATEIATLVIALVILLFGFALCGCVVFGHYHEAYSGWLNAFQTLLFVMLGEFDYEELDDIRPAYAFFYFFAFFVLIIAVLFNMIIAVIGGAYDAVGERLFSSEQRTALVQRMMCDPDTRALAPSHATGFRAWLRDGPVTRELRYWWFFTARRLVNNTRIKFGRKARPEDGSEGPSEHQKELLVAQLKITQELMHNPRIFWNMYHHVLTDLGSKDFAVAVNSSAVVKVMCAAAHVKQEMPTCECQAGQELEAGDVVYCRDGNDPWRKGIVDRVHGADAMVSVRCSQQQPSDRRYWRYAYKFDSIVHDFDYFAETAPGAKGGDKRAGAEAETALRSVVLMVDVAVEANEGEDGEESDVRRQWLLEYCRLHGLPAPDLQNPFACYVESWIARKGTTVALAEVPQPTVQGTAAWRETWRDKQAKAVGDVVCTVRYPAGTVEYVLRGKPFRVDRCSVTYDDWEPKPPKDTGKDALLTMMTVSDLLDESLGPRRRPSIEFFLAQLPAKVLGMNQARAYIDLLEHNHTWKDEVKGYATFENEEDLTATVKALGERFDAAIASAVQGQESALKMQSDTTNTRLSVLERNSTEMKLMLERTNTDIHMLLSQLMSYSGRGRDGWR
eukprot:TRINITY_DN1618_c0_g1_i1.p1 TRINITY_DN1618_c0_g1~~TRINITY_DN1618_c0_g1_i1.p1  ORF type:complete len:2851 (+),score=856.91 TRINITY_DN1618_c0_g1_i1:114-8555(+)